LSPNDMLNLLGPVNKDGFLVIDNDQRE
jgi:hypothetical protein